MNGEFINLNTAKKIQEDKNMDKDLLKIIEHYGILSQLKYFQSEVFELNEAIIEYEDRKNISDFNLNVFKVTAMLVKQHIIEEIADVMVMLMQFKEYYHIDGNEIMKIMKEKIDRQLGRIENESK